MLKDFLRALLILVVLIALGAGGYWLYETKVSPQAASAQSDAYTQLYAVQKGSISASLTVVGEVASTQQQDLTFEQMSSRAPLLTLAVQPGYKVQAGDVLATIEPEPYEQALDEALSGLQAAEEALAELGTPPTELEIAQADLAVAQAQLDLQEAQAALSDLQNPDIAELQAQEAEARVALAEAQADLAALQVDTGTQEQISRLQETLNDASAEYNRLAAETYSDAAYQDRLRLAYNTMMDAQDAVTRAQTQADISLHNAQARVSNAESSLRDAQAALAAAQAGPDALALAQAQMDITQAQVALTQAQAQRADLDVGVDATDLAAAQAQVDKLRLTATNAQAALDGTTLRAPFPGTVLTVHTQPGTPISADTPILTLANLDALQVTAAVDELTIRQVKAGQSATLTFDAFPSRQLAGTVGAVPLQGTLQGDVMVYQVPVGFENEAGLALLVGMTANVRIGVGSAEGVLVVPAMAVGVGREGYEVEVVSGEGTEVVPVEVGLSDGVNTEIVRGLNEGDQVVVRMSDSDSETTVRSFGGDGMSGVAIPVGPR